MKKFLYTLIITLFALTTQAQTIDEDRMHRDLEVAENALSTVLSPQKSQFPRLHFGDEDIAGDYIKDYGVIFMVEGHGHRRVKVFTAKGQDHDVVQPSEVATTEGDEKEHFIENSKTFLADYAGIIGQLDDDQMISVRRGGSVHSNLDEVYIATGYGDDRSLWSTKTKGDESELIVEVKVANINALRRGGMSRDDFFKSINVIENIMDYSKDADLETLSAMFSRLYKKDLSDTYYSERYPKYSKLSNFGVIIKMKFYSSYEDNKVYSMPTINKKGLTLEERNNHVMELLPKFESDFKENMVNYGRTLKNLDSDEVLLFEVNMTTCKGCADFPEIMKFSIQKSALHKYNRGSISMDEAVAMINVDRIDK